jgi:hypothetical protein
VKGTIGSSAAELGHKSNSHEPGCQPQEGCPRETMRGWGALSPRGGDREVVLASGSHMAMGRARVGLF